MCVSVPVSLFVSVSVCLSVCLSVGVRLGWMTCPAECVWKCGTPVKNDLGRIMSTIFNGASSLAQIGELNPSYTSSLAQIGELNTSYTSSLRPHIGELSAHRIY